MFVTACLLLAGNFVNVIVLCLPDLLFVQGTEVIFKVALCLLSSHEGEILECDTFENIVDYLKTTIPTLTQNQMEETIKKVQRQSLEPEGMRRYV